MLKSGRELERMRMAGKINAQALAAAVALIEPGISTAEINEAAATVLKEHDATPAFVGVPGAYPYPAETTISVNDELVHGIPGQRRLEDGDIVSIDCR
jgi:methionyl aminopeptidase